jgi:hypothetical protein
MQVGWVDLILLRGQLVCKGYSRALIESTNTNKNRQDSIAAL